jgi:hypothetical protein
MQDTEDYQVAILLSYTVKKCKRAAQNTGGSRVENPCVSARGQERQGGD